MLFIFAVLAAGGSFYFIAWSRGRKHLCVLIRRLVARCRLALRTYICRLVGGRETLWLLRYIPGKTVGMERVNEEKNRKGI